MLLDHQRREPGNDRRRLRAAASAEERVGDVARIAVQAVDVRARVAETDDVHAGSEHVDLAAVRPRGREAGRRVVLRRDRAVRLGRADRHQHRVVRRIRHRSDSTHHDVPWLRIVVTAIAGSLRTASATRAAH